MKLTVYLIAGSQTQNRADRALPARERFTGTLFQRSLQYAEAVKGPRDEILLISGSLGLLDPDRPIPRSDWVLAFTNKQERIGWGMIVASRLARRYAYKRPSYVILAGRTYADVLAPHLPRVELPFEGMAGNGEMVAWLNERLGGPHAVPLAAQTESAP